MVLRHGFGVATRFWCRDMVWPPWGCDLKLVSQSSLDNDESLCVATWPLVSRLTRWVLRVAIGHVCPAHTCAHDWAQRMRIVHMTQTCD